MSLNFGTPSSAPATSSLAGGFSFGANAKPAGFGLATSQPTTGLFGTPATAASAFGTAAPTFGTAAPTFGTSAPTFGTAAPMFGATSTPASFGGLGGNTSLSFSAGNNTTTTSTGLGFGAPISSATTGGLNFGAPVSAAPALGGFSFGAPASTSAPSLGFGLLGSTSTANTGLGLFGTTPSTATAISQPSSSVSAGLGGVAADGAGGVASTDSSAAGKGAEQQPKQQKLPNEISASVDAFNEFVKKQKSLGADVMRVSIKPMLKVSQQAEELTRAALGVAGEAARARAHSRRLRAAAARSLAAAEQAGRDPLGGDSEGLAPPAYVMELLAELEARLLTARRQMDIVERQMQAPQRQLTEQELALDMRRMHESLVSLAGRLQAAHAEVERQQQKYRALRTHLLKDNSSLLDNSDLGSSSLSSLLREESARKKKSAGLPGIVGAVCPPRDALESLQQATGPTPFSYISNTLTTLPMGEASGVSWSQPAQPQPTLGASLGTSGFGSFGTLGTADATSSFQLQKPPGKRGKQ